MHKPIIFLFGVIFLSFQCDAQIFSIGGHYEGMNLFVSNPIKADGYGFCVDRVLVNGNILPASIQTDYFEIDLTLFKLKKGEEVFIELEHGEGCTPSFVNPEVLLPFSTFEMVSFSANSAGQVTWSTKNESGKLSFDIEQYKWNRWVVAAEVLGKGQRTTNQYSINIIPTSGTNTIRITQTDNSGKKRSSRPITFKSTLRPVVMSPVKVKSKLFFKSESKPAKTKYEIYDAFGNLLKKGYADFVDCSDLLSGIYN
ncbi:MAG: hypothetical protein EBS17_08730, partial [Flavobacteriia bacterium]|nr:hypothetical protein [Flavobacteriia bacterium]